MNTMADYGRLWIMADSAFDLTSDKSVQMVSHSTESWNICDFWQSNAIDISYYLPGWSMKKEAILCTTWYNLVPQITRRPIDHSDVYCSYLVPAIGVVTKGAHLQRSPVDTDEYPQVHPNATLIDRNRLLMTSEQGPFSTCSCAQQVVGQSNTYSSGTQEHFTSGPAKQPLLKALLCFGGQNVLPYSSVMMPFCHIHDQT